MFELHRGVIFHLGCRIGLCCVSRLRRWKRVDVDGCCNLIGLCRVRCGDLRRIVGCIRLHELSHRYIPSERRLCNMLELLGWEIFN